MKKSIILTILIISSGCAKSNSEPQLNDFQLTTNYACTLNNTSTDTWRAWPSGNLISYNRGDFDCISNTGTSCTVNYDLDKDKIRFTDCKQAALTKENFY